MKTKIFAIFSCAVLLIAAGCKDKNTPETKPEPQPEPQVESIKGTVETPAWADPTEYDMTSSMTPVVKVDLTLTYPAEAAADGWERAAGDMLAAFAGDNCLGVDTLTPDRTDLFYLYVAGLNSGETGEFRLRYYSTKLKNIFDSKQTIQFKNNEPLGTVSDPYTPEFTVSR